MASVRRRLRLLVVEGREHIPRGLLVQVLVLQVRARNAVHGLVGEAEGLIIMIHVLVLHLDVLVVAHGAGAAGAGDVGRQHRGGHAGGDVYDSVVVYIGRRR